MMTGRGLRRPGGEVADLGRVGEVCSQVQLNRLRRDDGRPQDALEYARAALRGYESYGESAAEMIQRTRGLIGRIQQDL